MGARALVHAGAVLGEESRVGMGSFAVPSPQGTVVTADVEHARELVAAADFFGRAFGVDAPNQREVHRQAIDALRDELLEADDREIDYEEERMNRRQLGDSDLEVSEISLGSWLTYSGGVEREQTEACTRAAFDAGINFFDTANVYGSGAAEEAWGEILSDYRPRLLRARDQGLLPDVARATAGSRASRSTSSSTPR